MRYHIPSGKNAMKSCVLDIISKTTGTRHKHGIVFPTVSQDATKGVIINVGFVT